MHVALSLEKTYKGLTQTKYYERSIQKWEIQHVFLSLLEVQVCFKGHTVGKKKLQKLNRHDLHRCSKMTQKRFPEFKDQGNIQIFFFKI